MKTAVFSARSYDQRFLDEALGQNPQTQSCEWVYFQVTLGPDTARLAQGCGAVCVFVNDCLDAATLQALHTLGIGAILLRCAGFNNVDMVTATRLGLFVARVPAYSPEAVAEHTLALIMTLNRHTHCAYNRVREGNFMLEGLLGVTLHGRTVGIIGTGRIGLAAARILRGLGCTVLGCDPVPSPQFEGLGQLVSLEVLLAESDIVTLHCPLNEATHHLINARSLALMKPGAMLINTSRGALVDTQAVVHALKSRHLGHLAIDVYEQESELFFRDHSGKIIDDELFQRLMSFPNVLVTGHQGFFTIEALREIAQITVDNLRCFVESAPCPNAILAP